jgi:hypothetical protein
MGDASGGTYWSPHRLEQQLPHPTLPGVWIRHPSADMRAATKVNWMRHPDTRRNDPSYVEVKPEVQEVGYRWDVQGSMGCAVSAAVNQDGKAKGNATRTGQSMGMAMSMWPAWLRPEMS